MFSDATALFLAQPDRCWTGGRSDQPEPTLLGGGGAWEGEAAGAWQGEPAGEGTPPAGAWEGGAGEGSPPAGAAAELKCHKWQLGRGALASEGVHRHLR